MVPLRGPPEWTMSELPTRLPHIPEKISGRPKNYTRKKSTIEILDIKVKPALQKPRRLVRWEGMGWS